MRGPLLWQNNFANFVVTTFGFRPYITVNRLKIVSDKDNNNADEKKTIRISSLSEDEKFVVGIVKQDLLKSIDKAVDFSKAMITLVSGFFIAYFALFKFLGVETLSATNNTGAINGLITAPILFILSLIF